MKLTSEVTNPSTLVVGDIRDSLPRPINYMTDIAIYIAYLLVRAGLEPVFAKAIVIRVHYRWGFSSDFRQGIRICAADDAENSLELSVLVRKQTPVQATLTYHPKPGERWVSSRLRKRLIDAVGDARFHIKDSDIKEFKRLNGKLSVPSRAVAIAPASEHSVPSPAVTVEKPLENRHELLEDSTAQAVASSVTDELAVVQRQEMQELPKNDRYGHGTNRVSLKNQVCEQTVCLEFATNELGKGGKLFGSKAAYQLIEKALGVTLTEGETRGLMKGLVSRGYLQSIGSDPARYQVLPALYAYVNSAFPGCGDQLPSLSETPPTPVIEPPLPVVKAEKQTPPVATNPHEAKLAELSASIVVMESAKTEGEKLESELRAMRRAESVKATLKTEVEKLREIAQSLQVRLAEAEQNLEKKQLELADAESDSKLITVAEERLLELQHQYASLPAALEKRKKLAEALEKYNEAARVLAELGS